jgi:fatty-acyl-CoA synthase
MKGLMQDVPLTVDLLLRRAAQVGRGLEVVSIEPAGEDRRTWGEVAERVERLRGALEALGVPPGASVGTFAWNGHRDLELFLAVPAAGRVIHPVNVRLHPDQVAFAIRHARDDVLFVDASLTAALAPLRDRLDLRAVVVMDDGSEVDPAFADAPRYEDLLAGAPAPPPPPALREDDAASVCFTSGTTGDPKAVVYSHRSIVLHAFGALGCDSHAIRRGASVLPLTPMFHVNAWGLPYTCALAPAKLVLAGRDTSPEAVTRLIEAERVTVAAGIPTFWVQMQDAFAAGERDLSSLQAILCGGAEAPPALIAHYTERGIDFLHAWGMTEMSPSGTGTWVRAGAAGPERGARQGVPVPGVELRLVGGSGEELPWDGEAVGELQARGPWIAAGYLDADADPERFAGGWLRTGDMARIDPDGSAEIVDRVKDLIKSGGEWISSLDLERALAEHPDVLEAAVIAIPHERLGERPAALVVPRAGARPEPADLLAFLEGRVARWWRPDVVEVVAELPRTAVGKFDKKKLRAEHAERLARSALPGRPSAV